MKTIKLKDAIVKEVVLIPDGEIALSVLYEIVDDKGKVVLTKRVNVKKEDLPTQATSAVTELVSRITTRLKLLEEL